MAMALSFLLLSVPAPGSGQVPETVTVLSPDGEEGTLSIVDDRGFPAVPALEMESLGWVIGSDSVGDRLVLSHRAGRELALRVGSPLVHWDGSTIQMVDAPFSADGEVYVPLQIAVDLLPGLLPQGYRYEADSGVLLVGAVDEELAATEPGGDEATDVSLEDPRDPGGAVPPPPFTPEEGEYSRLVVIDPGHGGDDPGAIGPDGEEEKHIALAVSLALAQELANTPGTEVRLTRTRDVDVPIWIRGEWATEWREDRPAVFLSIHANALPDRSGVRGFETYFLSEARTEHERRVSAAENSVASEEDALDVDDPFLAEILQDLRAYDHQEWSAALAREIQTALGEFHPGPDRGVKQGPMAVITNSLMPSVLVEIGFISNPEEARAMEGIAFRREAARSLAAAIDRFFEQYAPTPEAPTF